MSYRDTTYQKIDMEIVKSNKSLIGLPIPGVEIELFDHKLKPGKNGEKAEIYVSGLSLSSGYLPNTGKVTSELG